MVLVVWPWCCCVVICLCGDGNGMDDGSGCGGGVEWFLISWRGSWFKVFILCAAVHTCVNTHAHRH